MTDVVYKVFLYRAMLFSIWPTRGCLRRSSRRQCKRRWGTSSRQLQFSALLTRLPSMESKQT